MKSQSRIYYGWYIVGTCLVIMAAATGIGATFPVFFKPLINEFQWSRAALSGVVSLGLVVGGLVTPFWGRWTDRSGARVVVVIAALFGGLSVLLRAQISALWQLYLLATLGAIFFAGIDLIPLSTAISHWFRNKRGTAMGIMLVGGGVGGFIMPPVANYFIVSIGWRNTYLLFAGIMWVAIIPVAGLIIRRRPQDLGLLPDGKTSAPEPARGTAGEKPSMTDRPSIRALTEDFTLKQAVRRLSFWLIAIAFFMPMMSGVGLSTHLIAMFTDMGMTSQRASACLGVIGGLSIVGRLAFGSAADRFSVRKVFATCYVIEAVGVSMLLTTPLFGTKALYAYVLIYGLTGGGGLVLAPLIIGECFGLRSLGTIFGVLAVAAVIGGAIGPLLAGLIFDITRNYYLAFIIFTCGEVVAATAISQARPSFSRKKVSQ